MNYIESPIKSAHTAIAMSVTTHNTVHTLRDGIYDMVVSILISPTLASKWNAGSMTFSNTMLRAAPFQSARYKSVCAH